MLEAACAAHAELMDEILLNLDGGEEEGGLLGELNNAEDAGKEKLLAYLDSPEHARYKSRQSFFLDAFEAIASKAKQGQGHGHGGGGCGCARGCGGSQGREVAAVEARYAHALRRSLKLLHCKRERRRKRPQRPAVAAHED